MIVTKRSRPSQINRVGSGNCRTQNCKPKILCIDDDPDISHAIEMALGNFEVELTCRYSGQQGIWSCLSERPDLIVTDWLMPDGSGDDLLMTLKRNRDTADIPIVVLSCLGGERMRNRLLSLGVAGCIQKPVTHVKLLAEVGRHIDLEPLVWASTGVE